MLGLLLRLRQNWKNRVMNYLNEENDSWIHSEKHVTSYCKTEKDR